MVAARPAPASYARAMDDHDPAGRAWLTSTSTPLGVPYELFACDPALADTAAFCAAYGFDPVDSANTIVVIGKSDPPRYAACVTLAPYRLDVNRVVRDRLGTRKASFAPAEETAALTGMQIGGVTVFGLPAGLPIWVDSRVMARERIVLGGGSRSWKVVAAPAILRALPGVEVVDDLATEPRRRPNDGARRQHPRRRGRRPADLPRAPGRSDREHDGRRPGTRARAFFDALGEDPGQRDGVARTIVADGTVVGMILSWLAANDRMVGYWIGREFWGRGYATRGLASDRRDR